MIAIYLSRLSSSVRLYELRGTGVAVQRGNESVVKGPALVAIVAIFSLAIGSFLNVLIHRLPKSWRRTVARASAPSRRRCAAASEAISDLLVPPSHCPQCKAPLRAIGNIPIASWLVLRGKCAHCAARISMRYPIVEALTAVLSAVVAWKSG